MEEKKKIGMATWCLLGLTLVFLVALAFCVQTSGRAGGSSQYTVTTQREAEGETAPKRVLININTATAEELETLTGVGASLAQKIVDYRETHGAFSDVQELLRVNGIGKAKLADMLEEITV